MSFGLGSLNPVHIAQKVNNAVVKPAIKKVVSPVAKTVRNVDEGALVVASGGFGRTLAAKDVQTGVVGKIAKIEQVAVSARASLATFGLSNRLLPKDVQRTRIAKISTVAGQVAGAGTVAVVAAPYAGAALTAAGTALKTVAIAKALTSKPKQPASLAPPVAPAPVAAPNPAKAGLWLTGAVALLQIL